MKRNGYGLTVAVLSMVLLAAFSWQQLGGLSLLSGTQQTLSGEYADDTVSYANGDYVYVPGEEHLSYDENESLLYYNNEILVYTEADLGDDWKKALADAADGVIVGEINGCIHMLQIAFDNADYDEIAQKARRLMEYEGVMYALCDYPIYPESSSAGNFEDTDHNPWALHKDEPIGDKGNEENPYGNDWWAEAIGAYTAWGYTQDSAAVTVGIIDNGFDLEHAELAGRMSMLQAFAWNDEESAHGTSVAGIIGAANNDIGLRGICSEAQMICADWSLNGGNILTNGEGEYTGAVLSEIVNQMAQQGVRVINLSLGFVPHTLDSYAANNLFNIFSYQDYLAVIRGCAKHSAASCIVLIDQLIKNNQDILFVQGAGNGWDNGYETEKYAGLFASITETVYDTLFVWMNPSEDDFTFQQMDQMVSYSEIRDHVLIVGAVDNVRNDAGDYQMTQYSNHGDSVEICAPGEAIFTTQNESFGSEYTDAFSGTSAAAPMVTGSAALLWGINPDLTAAEVKDLLIDSAVYEAYGYYFDSMRYPMLNIGNAAKQLYEEMNPPDNDEVLQDALDALVWQYGVIEVGTEEYYSASGGFEHVIPDSRITGLLAADIDDYDGDGNSELLVVRIEPYTEQIDGYSTGGVQQIHKTNVSLEMYGVQDGEIRQFSHVTFPLLGLSETEYQTAAHIFKTTDESGIRLYFDHFFSFNSQSFATIQLEYIDGSLRVTDGVELSEFAYSAGCYRAVSNAACATILGRQSYDIGQDGWEEYCSGYWDDYGEQYEEITWDTFQCYCALLSGMGLSESVTRSMFWGDWDGGAYAALQAEYGRCCLRPVEHLSVNSGTMKAICSLYAPYGQGSVTLNVEDETVLLYPYRTSR